jgi:predicted nuclease of predicted toxin-antitoxin system
VRILLDENLPRKLLAALQGEGHEVESVLSLKLKGLDNGRLYKLACEKYDICFTRDGGFAHNARQQDHPTQFKLIRVTLAQKPQDPFVNDFMAAFRRTRWEAIQHGENWPD